VIATLLALLALAVAGIGLLLWLSRTTSAAAGIATPLAFGALILAAWEIACRGFGIPLVLLPPPSAIAGAIALNGDTLVADFMQTFVRSVIPGWLIGNAIGLTAAILLDRSDFLRRGVLPLGSLVSAMPIVGIAPIMVMWFGFDWQSKAAVVVAMTVFPMLVNALAGLAEAGAMELDLMRSYAASYRATLVKLRLPAALPFIFTALKLTSTLALIGAIVAEFFGTPIVGMGFRISTEVAKMNLDLVWAEIVMAAVLGCASFALLALIERAATFWHPSKRA
jgi:NitT/TauT family transport system permease protein